jgi:hypothetical protein
MRKANELYFVCKVRDKCNFGAKNLLHLMFKDSGRRWLKKVKCLHIKEKFSQNK